MILDEFKDTLTPKTLILSTLALIVAISVAFHYRSSYTYVDLKPAPGIPPDPGRWATNRTLLGVDSDKDGIRDDVQRYILKLDEEIDNDFFIKALQEYARYYQSMLPELHLKEKSIDHFFGIGMASQCAAAADLGRFKLTQRTYLGPRPTMIVKQVRNLIVNNRTRRALIKLWISNIGRSLLVPLSNHAQERCSFDVEKIEGKRWK